jgi:hypothetical protein
LEAGGRQGSHGKRCIRPCRRTCSGCTRLKDQGIIDVARDAVMWKEEGKARPGRLRGGNRWIATRTGTSATMTNDRRPADPQGLWQVWRHRARLSGLRHGRLTLPFLAPLCAPLHFAGSPALAVCFVHFSKCWGTSVSLNRCSSISPPSKSQHLPRGTCLLLASENNRLLPSVVYC